MNSRDNRAVKEEAYILLRAGSRDLEHNLKLQRWVRQAFRERMADLKEMEHLFRHPELQPAGDL
jgi:hypothetical protein